MNTTTFNGIEIPHTPENMEIMRKALEEYEGGEEIKKGDEYYFRNSFNGMEGEKWTDSSDDKYRKEQDNCLPCKNYTKDQAIEYFNKRDARRAAETKLRKIIADMNKKDGFVADFSGGQDNYYSEYNHEWPLCKYSVYPSTNYQALPLWRYSSRATAKFINENHADLLDIYLERE
jgi:hypothetical protein